MKQHAYLFPIKKMALVMRVSVRGYYTYLRRVVSAREKANSILKEKIKLIYVTNRGLYGSPRIHAVLQTMGYACSRKRVAKLMQKLGLRARMNKKFYHRKKTCIEAFPDRLQQNFRLSCPNTVWVADISYNTSKNFRELCEGYGIEQSMSHGSCYDNAVMESFFHTFKTRKEAKMALFEYIEHFYNRKRLHSALGYVSAEQFEQDYENQTFCVSSV